MGSCPRCGKSYGSDVGFCPEDGARIEPAKGDRLEGVHLDDRYLLEQRIGAGGLGQVYRARHLRMDKAFAVKLLLPAVVSRPEMIQRFDREARALSRLKHPCCVAVTDYGVSERHGPYIVMELVEGVPLSHHTRGEGLSLPDSVELVTMMLRGLEHAHGQGIAHRDLKPDNIMLVPRPLEPGRLLPKILDFGLAKLRAGIDSATGGRLTQAGLIMGTPSYMAPERIASPTDADDELADIYAAGVILYELCCRQLPFPDDDLQTVLKQHLSRTPPPPRSLRPSMPPALEEAILRAMAKIPAERFSTAAAFRQCLERLPPLPADVAEERPPPAGRSTGALTRIERPRRGGAAPTGQTAGPAARRKLLLGAAVLAVVVLVAGGIALLTSRGGGQRHAGTAEGPARRAAADAGPSSPEAQRTSPGLDAGPSAASAPAPPTADDLPPAMRRAVRLWSNPHSRKRAAQQLMRLLARHRSDAAAHLYVGRLYLYAFWADDGLKLVQRARRIDPSLRLDTSTLVALTFAYRGSTRWAARRLIEAEAGDRAPIVLLASAAAMRDPGIRRSLIQDARRMGTERSRLARDLLALAEARTCKQRRLTLRALWDRPAARSDPALRIMLSLLRGDRCLMGEARQLAGAAAP